MSAIQHLKAFEFYKKNESSFRIQVAKFNNQAFIGFGKFYYNRKTHKLEPTKKQVFIPREAWPAFTRNIEKVTAELKAHPGKFNNIRII
jgi:hypothetical protein